ncbi:MAG: dephospho-CoA kinase [Flavobacteriaceae bacterium]|nr:dephospho-CoA kinase [Flavobacteriaceae bacterium]
MVQLAVTGNMGCGKTTICEMLILQGIPVYFSDNRAKELMNQDQSLIQHIKKRFGKESYRNGLLNRKWLSERVFKDPKALNDLNSLVHPIVHKDYLEWVNQQSQEVVAYESAIVLEHGNEGKFDVVILVSCPEKLRLERIQQRDGLTQGEIQSRTRFQWSDEKKRKHADHIIENINLSETEQQVKTVLSLIRKQFLID